MLSGCTELQICCFKGDIPKYADEFISFETSEATQAPTESLLNRMLVADMFKEKFRDSETEDDVTDGYSVNKTPRGGGLHVTLCLVK